jgi:hypothetical protein
MHLKFKSDLHYVRATDAIQADEIGLKVSCHDKIVSQWISRGVGKLAIQTIFGAKDCLHHVGCF